MEKNPSLSNLHVRTKANPHVRYDKETDETITSVTYEEIIEKIEEKNMEKVEPMITYHPSYIPIERELLYSISNLVVALKHKDEPIADLPACIEVVDAWLALRYADLEDVLVSGNGHLECEEDS